MLFCALVGESLGKQFVCTAVHTHTHTRTHAHTHAHTHTHTHNTRAHTHKHTHTHVCVCGAFLRRIRRNIKVIVLKALSRYY
jgi:ABC-type Zn2+ transport system substrate-binding protein/surface adhesin